MLFLMTLCIAALVAAVAFPSRAKAETLMEATEFRPRQQHMLEAANAIAVMLFSNSFERAELGEKALEIIARALDADFMELWKNQSHPQNQPRNQLQDGTTAMTCNQVCWWERSGLNIHSQKARTISYDRLFRGWLEKFNRNNIVVVTKGNASRALCQEIDIHKTDAIIAIPVFFENALWGFLRLGVKADFPPLTEHEQRTLRSIGLFLVASIRRHQTQTALRNTEERFKDITLATGGIIWELDANGFFSYVSQRIEEVSGYTAEELMGKRWEDISADNDKDITSQLFQAGVTKSFFDNFEHAIVTSSGTTVWLRSAAKLLVDSFGIAGLRGTSFDYTKARDTAQKLEDTLQALQNSNIELEQAVQHAYTLANKANSANSAKQNFLNNISHEIRTPLNAISGTLYLLENTRLNRQQKQYLTRIKDASGSLMVVVDSMLHFSNIQSGKVESVITEVHLTKLFENIAELFSTKLAQKNLYGVFAIASDVPINLLGDATSLRQTLTNLLDNAIKFTEHGAVALTCSLAKQKSANDIVLQFSIDDTGIGIPCDLQQTMLEAFTQKDASSTRRFGGTGLGLTIANQLVTINGGQLTLNSEPGEGTSISFTFRMLPPTRPQLEYPPRSFFQHVTIIVDGGPGEKFFINAMQNMGYAVDTIHVDDLDQINTKGSNPVQDMDILYGPLHTLQSCATELSLFFKSFFEAPPAVVALTPQTAKLSHLPDFITHIIAGPALTFLSPKAIDVSYKDKAIAFFHRDHLTHKQLATMQDQVATIISLLEESDTEGQARFLEIKAGLAEIDERITTEIDNHLTIFQFSEAIPLLAALRDKIESYEQ